MDYVSLNALAEEVVPSSPQEQEHCVRQALAKARRLYRYFISIDALFALLVALHVASIMNTPDKASAANALIPQWEVPLSQCLVVLLVLDMGLALSMYCNIPQDPRATQPIELSRYPYCPTFCCFLALSNLIMNSLTTFLWAMLRLATLDIHNLTLVGMFVIVAFARVVKLVPMLQLWEALCGHAVGDTVKLEAWKAGRFEETMGAVSERILKSAIFWCLGIFVILTVYLYINGASWADVGGEMTGSQDDYPPGLTEPNDKNLTQLAGAQPISLNGWNTGSSCWEGSIDGYYGEFCCDPTCKSGVMVHFSDGKSAARGAALIVGGALAGAGTGAGIGVAIGSEFGPVGGVVGGVLGGIGGLVGSLDSEPANCLASKWRSDAQAHLDC